MGRLRFYINNNEIDLLPDGWKDMDIELSYGDVNAPRLSVESFEFKTLQEVAATADPVEILQTWIDGGTNGTTGGIFEGVPYQIVLDCDGSISTVFNGILDLSDSSAQFSCDRIIAPARQLKGQDYLNDKADSFRFEYLAKGVPIGSAGKITTSDYIEVWYQVGKYPQGVEIMIASLTLFMLIRETISIIKDIGYAVAAISGGGTGILESILMIVALTVYLVSMIIAMVELMKDLVELIFPWVYYHYAMYAKDLVQKACDYLGLGFSSTILQNDLKDMYIMPKKQASGSNFEGYKVGYASSEDGYYDGTFGQLLTDLETQTDGIARVINGTLYFETEDWYQNQSNYAIPDMEVEFTGYNASELTANYNINYADDNADLYNYLDYTGTSVTAQVIIDNLVSQDNSTLKGLTDKQINFTLPTVKTTETRLENTMKKVFNAYSALVNAVIAYTLPSAGLTIPPIPSSTINILRVDTHFTSVPKVGIQPVGQTGRTFSTTYNTIGAKALFEAYHAQNIAKPIYGYQGNQWKLYKGYQIPLCCEDFQTLLNNNYCTYLGNEAKITSLRWNPYNEVADIDFQVREQYISDLTVDVIYDGGKSGSVAI